MKRLLFITFLFAASLSCNKEEVANIDLPTAFTASEAQDWFEKYTKNKKQARVIKKEKPIFGDDYNPAWELAYEEVHDNGSKTIYAPFDSGVSSATPVMDKIDNENKKDKKLDGDLIFPRLNRVAITKETDGSVTFRLVQYISFDKVPKKRKKAINLFEKFEGVVMFFDEKEDFLFGNYFEEGKYVGSVNSEDNLNNKDKKKAKINCEQCNYFYVQYFFYSTSIHHTSEPVLSYTVYYGICIPCSGGSGSAYPQIMGITPNNTGGNPTNSSGNWPFYNPNKTFILAGSECEAYLRARNLAASYGREFNGVKAYDADNNRYFWIIFPSIAGANTFTGSEWLSVYGSTASPVQWGEGMAPFFQVFVDLNSGTIEPRFNYQGYFGWPYTIISTFHTHPNGIGNSYVVSPEDKTFASNYTNITHFAFEQNGVRSYNGNGYSDSGHRTCQN